MALFDLQDHLTRKMVDLRQCYKTVFQKARVAPCVDDEADDAHSSALDSSDTDSTSVLSHGSTHRNVSELSDATSNTSNRRHTD